MNWRKKKDSNEDGHSQGIPAPAEKSSAANEKFIDNYSEGLALYDEGRFAEATIAFDEVIKKERRHEFAHHYKAASLYKLGQPEKAEESIVKAIEVNHLLLKEYNTNREIDKVEETKERLGRAYQLKGSIVMELGRKSEAVDCFSKVSEYCPRLAMENPEFDQEYVQGVIGAILSHLRMVEYYEGQALINSEKDINLEEYEREYRHAKERLNEYLKIKPYDIDALFLKGEVMLNSLEPGKINKEDLEEVTKALNEAIKLDPAHAPVHTILGMAYRRQSSRLSSLALECYNKAIAMFEDRITKVGNNSNNRHWMQDRDTKKIPSWKDWDYITLRMYLAFTIMGRSLALAGTGKEREALENLEEAEKIHFDNFQRTATVDDVNYVSVRYFYADNFLRKSLVSLALAAINFRDKQNQNVLIKLDDAERQLDIGIKFIEDLQKDMAAGKIRYISARQIVNIRTAEDNFKYLQEFIRMGRIRFRNGRDPSFIQ